MFSSVRVSGCGTAADSGYAAVAAMILRKLQAVPSPLSLCDSHSWLQMKKMMMMLPKNQNLKNHKLGPNAPTRHCKYTSPQTTGTYGRV